MFSGSLETLQLTGAQHAKIGTYIRMESGQIRRVYGVPWEEACRYFGE